MDLGITNVGFAGLDEPFWRLSEDYLLYADRFGSTLKVSDSWGRRLGFDEAALLRVPLFSFIQPADLPQVVSALQGIRVSPRPVTFEARLRDVDWIWHRVSWVMSPDPTGELLFGVGRETPDLAAAGGAGGSAGLLASGLAHDFNNLLTVISLNLETLQQRLNEPTDQALRRNIRIAESATQRAAALTRRLLAFSRNQSAAAERTDVVAVLLAMQDLLDQAAGVAGRVELRIDPDTRDLMCDARQLENVMLNLVMNSRDALGETGRIVLQTANWSTTGATWRQHPIAPGLYVELAMADNGAGMSADIAARVLEPFFTTKAPGKGSGLGLWMAATFAQQAGGAIDVSSTPGLGTTVSLLLPAL